MPKKIIVEVNDLSRPSLSPGGQKAVATHEHEAEHWATAHGGDLLVLDAANEPLAIYARGAWRRAYFPETNP